MTPERWKQIKLLLDTVLELEPQQQLASLYEIYPDDDSLRREVEGLIDLQAQADSFIEVPASELLVNHQVGKNIKTLNHRIDSEIFAGTDRFIIQDRLGAGAFGVVYQAYDRELETTVALKHLYRSDADAIYRFKREFRALTDITHPNLIKLYELISTKDQWFFTMELVDGVNFLKHLSELSSTNKAQPVRSLSLTTIKQLRESLKQLAEAINALHQLGKIHRDIKPSNVLVTKQGRVVLLDFGMVTEISAPGLQPNFYALGTPNYMAPEQALGQPVTTASDWYSFGVILYEALTGKTPFTGQFFDMLMKKQALMPTPPTKLATGVPADLEALCLSLLLGDPLLRADGYQVLDCLGANRLASESSLAISSSPLATRFIGRNRELQLLTEALENVKNPELPTTTLIYIHGSSGIGKSTLVHHFLDQVQQQNCRQLILSGKCYSQESVPYKAFDGIVDTLSRYLKRLTSAELAALLPENLTDLSRLFPVFQQLASLVVREPAIEIPDSKEQRRRAFQAFRQLMINLADHYHLILFIDDLQWGDIDSLLLLAEILRAPDPARMLIIGSYRDEEINNSPFLSLLPSLHSTIQSAVEIRDLLVEGFSAIETAELVFALLPEQQPGSINYARAITAESAGNPFLIHQLTQYSQHANSRITDNNHGDNINLTAVTLNTLLQTRISQLPEEARRLLQVIMVAGRPVARKIAKIAANIGEQEQSALTLLRTNRLVRIRGFDNHQEIEPYHDRIWETIVGNLPLEIKRSHHYNLAITMEANGPADPELLTVHFYQGEQRDKAASYAIIAATQADQAMAFNRAVKLYQFALEFYQEQKIENRPLMIKLGDALTNAGRGSEAAVSYLAAVDETDKTQALELERRAAEQFLTSGHMDKGLEMLRKVLSRVGMKLAKTPRRALFSFLAHRAWINLRGFKFKERKATEISAEELTRIDVCWSTSIGLVSIDNIRGADFQMRHLQMALKAGEPYRIARALAMEINYSSTAGLRNQLHTQQLIQITRELAERIQHPHAIAIATFSAGVAAAFEGRWYDVYPLSAQAETIFRDQCKGVSWEFTINLLFKFLSLLWQGEIQQISNYIPSIIKEAQELGNIQAVAYSSAAFLTIIYLAADQPDIAESKRRETIDNWVKANYQKVMEHEYMHITCWEWQVQICLYTGDATSAWNIVQSRWLVLSKSMLRRMQQPFIGVLQIHARAALAAAVQASAQNPATTRQLLKTAEDTVQQIEREKMPWGNRLAKLLRAGIAATRGEQTKAVTLLAEAEAGFEQDHLGLYAAVTRRRRGEMIGGETGQAMIAEANEWMAKQLIKNPTRMTAMIAPGRWQS